MRHVEAVVRVDCPELWLDFFNWRIVGSDWKVNFQKTGYKTFFASSGIKFYIAPIFLFHKKDQSVAVA